ncbi:MAG: hypothetical protein ACK46D_00400 [Roseiflexaceae bacterium]|jgi:hypothetical protein
MIPETNVIIKNDKGEYYAYDKDKHICIDTGPLVEELNRQMQRGAMFFDFSHNTAFVFVEKYKLEYDVKYVYDVNTITIRSYGSF